MTTRRHHPPPKPRDDLYCHGKPSRRHIPTIRVAAWVGMRDTPACRETPRVAWACGHQEVCTRCGKVTRSSLNADCPDRP